MLQPDRPHQAPAHFPHPGIRGRAGRLATSLVPAVTDRLEGPTGADDDVLTLDELAGMLKLDSDTVMGRVHSGELPGRRFGDQWRFARRAVLAWLDGTDGPRRTAPGFGPSPRTHGGEEKG